jgi:hypothetical protein
MLLRAGESSVAFWLPAHNFDALFFLHQLFVDRENQNTLSFNNNFLGLFSFQFAVSLLALNHLFKLPETLRMRLWK